jgi:uncharacterized membrane protein
VAAAINQSGVIVGEYDDAVGTHGFLLKPDGTYTLFDAPGSVNTNPSSINDAGAITGYYVDAANNYHAFARSPAGTFVTFGPVATFPSSINNSGAITGSEGTHGFVRP